MLVQLRTVAGINHMLISECFLCYDTVCTGIKLLPSGMWQFSKVVSKKVAASVLYSKERGSSFWGALVHFLSDCMA